MTDPLLSSLCRICHTRPPKYRCPRCQTPTCSLPCTKRHKLWASCNGARDPTVFKPRHELATPAGIDHDYNFISAIERGIARSEKEIVEERKLVGRGELRRGFVASGYDGNSGLQRRGGWHRRGGPSRYTARDQRSPLEKALERSRVIMHRAPRGLQRNKDNSTRWSKNQRTINWTIEWIRPGHEPVLSNALGVWSIERIYAEILEAEMRKNLIPADRKTSRKRRAAEVEKEVKRRRTCQFAEHEFESDAPLQDALSSAWNYFPGDENIVEQAELHLRACEIQDLVSGLHFYLLHPMTPSSQPQVLIPLEPSDELAMSLADRVVLEFPTIYVLNHSPERLPPEFRTEAQYYKRGSLPTTVVLSENGESDDEENTDNDEDDEGIVVENDEDVGDSDVTTSTSATSSSGESDSTTGDDLSEDGEII